MQQYIVVGSSVADSETGLTWYHRQSPREAHKTAAGLNRVKSDRKQKTHQQPLVHRSKKQ